MTEPITFERDGKRMRLVVQWEVDSRLNEVGTYVISYRLDDATPDDLRAAGYVPVLDEDELEQALETLKNTHAELDRVLHGVRNLKDERDQARAEAERLREAILRKAGRIRDTATISQALPLEGGVTGEGLRKLLNKIADEFNAIAALSSTTGETETIPEIQETYRRARAIAPTDAGALSAANAIRKLRDAEGEAE